MSSSESPTQLSLKGPRRRNERGKWASGKRRPSFETALKVGDLFQVNAERLARAPFGDLLSHELSDPERFRAVENTVERMMRDRGLLVRSDSPNEKVASIENRRQRKGVKR